MRARRTLIAAMIGALIVPLVATGVAAPAQAAEPFPVTGADVSWPQCPIGASYAPPMPLSTAKFVVFGLTGGYGYT